MAKSCCEAFATHATKIDAAENPTNGWTGSRSLEIAINTTGKINPKELMACHGNASLGGISPGVTWQGKARQGFMHRLKSRCVDLLRPGETEQVAIGHGVA
jgi:hypothetical protein